MDQNFIDQMTEAQLAELESQIAESRKKRDELIVMTKKQAFSYDLTPDLNGGESLELSVIYYEIGMPTETITLNSYGSCASITTSGVFTSENLFKLAKSLKKFEERVALTPAEEW